MSGILNTKQTILDTIITRLGRSQLADGTFKISKVTFTDGATFYQADVTSGSDDPSNRLFFECSQLPQDHITFMGDDAGKLLPMANSSGYNVSAGNVFSGSSVNLQFVTGSEFLGIAEGLLGSSIDNFTKLLTIGTIDPIFEDAEFQLSHNSLNFNITDTSPINDPTQQTANVNNVESFFADKRLSNIPNFKFLPPINKVSDKTLDLTDPKVQRTLASPALSDGTPSPYYMATYKPLGATEPLDFDLDVQPEIDAATKIGNVQTISFSPTTNKNNLAMQAFEFSSNSLTKLDVIDFGKFPSGDPTMPDKHVFYVGKVFLDDNQTHSFVKLFTLIFE